MTDDSLTIIRATAAELDLLAPLFDGYRQFYRQPSDPAAARAFLEARLARNESVIFLARRGEQGLGFVQLYPSFSSVSLLRLWILNDLFVAREGRRQGVAGALLERAGDFAVETKSKGLVLETEHTNAAAQQLYEKLGWHRIESDCRFQLRV